MDPRITWAIEEIERRLDSEIPLGELAAATHLSASHFAHLFRREVGMSPARYVRGRRLERARVLLETTFLTVKEIMVTVGLNDPSHFTRNFRQHHGAAPTEWRSNARRARDDAGKPPAAQ